MILMMILMIIYFAINNLFHILKSYTVVKTQMLSTCYFEHDIAGELIIIVIHGLFIFFTCFDIDEFHERIY